MPVVNTVACAVCGRQKSPEFNHWFFVHVIDERPGTRRVQVEEFEELKVDQFARIGKEFVCGAEHAQVWFSQWLSSLQSNHRPAGATRPEQEKHKS